MNVLVWLCLSSGCIVAWGAQGMLTLEWAPGDVRLN